MFYYKSKVSLAAIPDGTSNTLAFVECAGGLFNVPGDPFFSAPTWTMNAWAWGVWWAKIDAPALPRVRAVHH